MSTCETVIVTPSYAKTLRETANFELQRRMSENNIMRLRMEMDAQRFIPGTPIYFAVLPNKSMVALNGNHTLEAVSRGDGSVELTFVYQNVKNLTEAASIYSRLDLHKMRSWRDSLRAFNAEAMLRESTVWTAGLAASIGIIMASFNDTARYGDKGTKDSKGKAIILLNSNRELRLRLMKHAEPAAALYADAIGYPSGGKQFFKRAPIFSVGIEIMRYQPSTGTEFFREIARDDGLRRGDPRKTLLAWLRDNNGYGMIPRGKQSRSVAAAWNAFFQGRELNQIRVANSDGPIIISGTPWNGSFDPIIAYAPEIIEHQVKSILKKTTKPKAIKTGVDSKGKAVAVHA